MLPKHVMFVLLLHNVLQSVNCYAGSAMLKTKPKSSGKSRQKRLTDLINLITEPQLNFYFEFNACYALAVVLSLPLETPPSSSVFCSYNFETNYYYAYFDNAQGLTPVSFSYITQPGTNTGSPYHKIKRPNSYGQEFSNRQLDNDAQPKNDSINATEEIDDEKLSNRTSESALNKSPAEPNEGKSSEKKQTKAELSNKKSRKLRGLLQNYFMSRRRFFKMMESKIERSQLNGNDCLLKAICETAAHTFGEHNGVIGSVVDVLFLPSASKDEKLPKRYYKAEENGKLNKCEGYNKLCPRGVFDLITTLI
ncbi:hypothetical protein Bhyg_02259 [Pseudolycoriella hygida]|uniref:Uncharacterized protein n=1 Tax=Pseudolycoriella hygida TaxID=35572 RepID=A0A9Q0NCL5_9DIPT|nr:hypothetical protein Bhyg_02259 [Pseudolycoriella hygida]